MEIFNKGIHESWVSIPSYAMRFGFFFFFCGKSEDFLYRTLVS